MLSSLVTFMLGCFVGAFLLAAITVFAVEGSEKKYSDSDVERLARRIEDLEKIAYEKENM